MLNSLNIKNYRNLKDLRINSLCRINLITGKNNTGKSSILEAIAIFATKGDLSIIHQLLIERGEEFRQKTTSFNPFEANLKSLSTLFTNRIVGFDAENTIIIGSLENPLFGNESVVNSTISLRFVQFFDQIERDSQGNLIARKRTVLENIIDEFQSENYKIGLEIKIGKTNHILAIEDFEPSKFGYKITDATEKIQFIRTRNIDKDTNGILWDGITLTAKEQYVYDALKIIEPTTERIAFIGENTRERTAVIKLTNLPSPLPLKSMGDGINRILTIILALINAENGFLLIDEFENGLHHTVQEKLWNIIFKLAEKLNVQVFVTTHSEDCIAGFESVLNSNSNTLDGKLIRLDNQGGTIKQVEFDANELKIATEQDIETR
jgi:AAA15 family ATPase/GTPase